MCRSEGIGRSVPNSAFRGRDGIEQAYHHLSLGQLTLENGAPPEDDATSSDVGNDRRPGERSSPGEDGGMVWTARIVVALAFAIGGLGGCSTAPGTREAKDELVRQAAAALNEWNREIPGVEGFAQRSYGYAMFPEIAKGGIGIGAAYGRGVVYEQGRHIGYADVTHGSLGAQVGGQAYQQLVVFDGTAALERFKRGGLDFSADTSGVLLTTGYAAHVQFIEGVTIFSRPLGGAMGEASMGAQRFTFVMADDRE